MPMRVQLSRKKGWRRPKGCVVVARPTKFGNPYRARRQDRAEVVAAFRMLIERGCCAIGYSASPAEAYAKRKIIIEHMDELRGKDLACWCPLDQPCHADVLLRIADR